MSDNAEQLDAFYAAYSSASEERKQDALNQLIEAMRKSAWAISFRVLGQALPDAVNDSVTGAIQTLHTFKGKARFSTWFYSVVQIHCKMALIAKMSRPAEISLEQLAEEGAEPSVEIENAESAKLDLNKLLAALEEEERNLLQLRAEGHTFAEIAAIMGLNEEAAYSRWRRLTGRIEKARKVQEIRSALVADSVECGSERGVNAGITQTSVGKERGDDHQGNS